MIGSAPVVLSLFDYTGEAVRPWAEAGYLCICLDKQHEPDNPTKEAVSDTEVGSGGILKVYADLSGWTYRDISETVEAIVENDLGLYLADVVFVFGWPPCDDLAGSGAKHWAKKRQANPGFQEDALDRALSVRYVGEMCGAPWLIENPVGALSTLWRKPDHIFSPHQYGGYCPDGPHPRWPEYIPEKDAYSKKTCLWSGNGFIMPKKDAVEPEVHEVRKKDGTVTRGSRQWAKLGGKSMKTKNIRSATPRGFSKAVFLANAPHMKEY